jgi:molybdopterin adenylyltransferase
LHDMADTIKAAIVIASDGAYHGSREDTSGQLLESLLNERGFEVAHKFIVPDERATIASTLKSLVHTEDIRLILTSGGTGLGPRDVTPEATLDVVSRTIPGMAEAMRAASIAKTPFAMTSRQVVGAAGNTLIINFPGSPKAVQECFDVVSPVIHHVLDLLAGHTQHESQQHG